MRNKTYSSSQGKNNIAHGLIFIFRDQFVILSSNQFSGSILFFVIEMTGKISCDIDETFSKVM